MTSPYRLPMFPLGTPLLPGRLLPLRIFEPRYVALLRECLSRESPEFGVVLIERGGEVGGGDQRTMVGTAAGIVESLPRPTGDISVVAIGRRRIRVVEWLPDDPHPWAVVEDWSDIDEDIAHGEGSDLRRVVDQALEKMHVLTRLSGSGSSDLLERLEASVGVLEPSTLSFAMAAAVGFGSADLHRLLCCAGAEQRLECMLELLEDLEAVVRFRLSADTDD